MLQTHNIAWRKFCSLFLNIVKKGTDGETKNCPNSSFSHNFCHWLSEKFWKILSVAFHCWSFWITLKVSDYPLHHYYISRNNFWSPNKQLKYLGKWGNIFQVKPNYKHYKEHSNRRVIGHEIAASRKKTLNLCN